MTISPFKFLQAIQGPQPAQERIGTVATVNPLTVLFDGEASGDEAPCAQLQACTPYVGARVVCVMIGKAWTAVSTLGVPAIQRSKKTCTVTASTSSTTSVTFLTPYTTVPAIFTNMNSAPGATLGWITRAINETTTGFDVYMYGPSQTFTVDVDWVAVGY